MFNLPYWIGEIHHETNTRSPILTNDNNLVTAELQRLREKKVNYSDKHTTKSLNFEINNKVRHKVDHRPCDGGTVVEKSEGPTRLVIIQTNQGKLHLHKT